MVQRLTLVQARDRGATLMLEAVQKHYFVDFHNHTLVWDEYRKRLRGQSDEAIREHLRNYRFSLLDRAGRDGDWIRSWRRYGVPPVPD